VSLLEHLINFAPSRRLSAEQVSDQTPIERLPSPTAATLCRLPIQALRSPFFAALASSKLTRESLVFPPVSAAFEFRFEVRTF